MGNLSNLARRNMNATGQQGSVVQPGSPEGPRMAGVELKRRDADETTAPGREYRRLGSFRDFG